MKTETAIIKHQMLIMNSVVRLYRMYKNPKSKYYIKGHLGAAIGKLNDAATDLDSLLNLK